MRSSFSLIVTSIILNEVFKSNFFRKQSLYFSVSPCLKTHKADSLKTLMNEVIPIDYNHSQRILNKPNKEHYQVVIGNIFDKIIAYIIKINIKKGK